MPLKDQITVIEAQELLKKNENIRFLDVRAKHSELPEQFKSIEHVPARTISRHIQDFEITVTLILVCEDGTQSSKAHTLLQSCGYNARVVRGGFKDWIRVFELNAPNNTSDT